MSSTTFVFGMDARPGNFTVNSFDESMVRRVGSDQVVKSVVDCVSRHMGMECL